MAFLTSVGLGLLSMFGPLAAALEKVDFLNVGGKAGFVPVLIGFVALGNSLGLMLTAIWQRERRRLLAVRFLAILAVSTGLAIAALQLSWELALWWDAVDRLVSACDNIMGYGYVVYALLCMDAVSLAACLAWYLVGWMIARLWPVRPRPAASA